jgi:error-prone DNA polymerase
VDITCSDWLCTLEAIGATAINGLQGTRNDFARNGFEGARLQPRRNTEANSSASAAEETGGSYESEAPQWIKPGSCSKFAGTPEGVPLQNQFALRMGFRYAKGLREEIAHAILRERNKRPFESIADLAYRVPQLRRNELVLLASIGALNGIGGGSHVTGRTADPSAPLAAASSARDDNFRKRTVGRGAAEAVLQKRLHRRDALWQVERAARFAGPLLESIPESDSASPLSAMTHEERLVADFHGTGLTVGPHPMAYRRADLKRARVLSAEDLKHAAHGRRVRTAGCVIARQRPGTAKGFVFLSLEDETGISNAIITPDILDQNRILITTEKFLLLEGLLQKQESVISVKVERVRPMREAYAVETVDITDAEVRSHDFH